MNSLSSESEPVMMTEEFLYKIVEEKMLQKEYAHIIKKVGFHFDDVSQLELQHRGIMKIDCLWKFTILSRLDLNNNLIEKIEGLDRLANLTWLNLSFNKITKIEGLESLRKLEILNLSGNRISVIENMDSLENLTHFCFSNNLVGQLDQVLYLRKFKNLFTLNLHGNPVSEEEDYKFFIAAYFPNLTCLDFNFLDKETKREASVKYHYALEDMKCKRQEADEAEQRQQMQEAEMKLHKDAFVESLNGPHLFKSMIKDDPQAQTLHCVPGEADLLQTFEQQMVELCTQLFETGLAEHKRREKEMNAFFSGQTIVMKDCQQTASEILENFEKQHREMVEELQQLTDPDAVKEKIKQCNDGISHLSDSLKALEFQLVSQQEEMVRKFDRNISDMVDTFTETARGIFAQCRDLEDNYYEKVREIAVTTLEDIANDTLNEDMPEDVKMLFSDKGAVMDALPISHDNHQLTISDRETQLVTRVSAWKTSLIREIQDKDLKHSRMRITDLHRYCNFLKEQLDMLHE